MSSMRSRFLRGLILVAALGLGSAQSMSENASAKSVPDKLVENFAEHALSRVGFIPAAQEADVTDRAREIFRIGETAAEYDAMMERHKFNKVVTSSGGQRLVVFSRKEQWGQLAHKEVRIILYTPDDDRIASLEALVFFHTL
jgi:hypothetical protein